MKWLLLTLAIALSSCAYPGKSTRADSDLERGIRFVEVDERNRNWDLSASKPKKETSWDQGDLFKDGAEASRIPDPRVVDINSTIHLVIDHDGLDSSPPSSLSSDRSAKLLQKKERVLAALNGLREAIRIRGATVEAYAALLEEKNKPAESSDVATARAAFRELRKKFGIAENDAIQNILAAWEDDPHGFARIDAAAGADTNYAELQRVLQAEVAEIEVADLALAEEMKDREVQLRIHAWLGSGDKRSAIHVPRYDDLATGQVVRRDRSGLDLPPEDMARLRDQWAKTRLIAETAEDIRIEKKELRDGLREIFEATSPKLAEAFSKMKELEAKVLDIDVNALLAETKEDLEALRRAAGEAGDELAQEAKDRIRSDARKWLETTRSLKDLLALVRDARALAARWKNPDPADATVLVLDSAELVRKLERVISGLERSLPKRFLTARAEIQGLLEDLLEDLGEDAIAAAKGLLEDEAAVRLNRRLAEMREIWDAGEAVYEALADLTVKLEGPVEGNFEAPHAHRVPYELIRDTWIDLTLTPRRAGDRVFVQAELYRGDDPEPIDSVQASFQPEYLGWHARLSPSVVLVRPTRMEADDEQFTFAPMLSWMHHYRPRPEHTGFWDGLARSFDPAVGIHAAFVNFDPDTAVEIGLGATLSVWQDHLQFGAGVNLMGNGADDGRYYFFVGSDLISLLNAMGLSTGL